MPPKLSKRQQREIDELEALKASQADASEDEEQVSTPSTFAQLLSVEEPEECEEESDHASTASKPRKGKKKKKKPSSTPTKKAVKKQKAKEKSKESQMDELDQALAELSVKYPEIKAQLSARSPQGVITTANNSSLKQLPNLLSVSLSHLDSEAELRKFFGSRVVQANKPVAGSSSSPSSGSSTHRRQGAVLRSHLTRPKPTWWAAKQREGISIRAYTSQEVGEKFERCGWDLLSAGGDEKWWTVEYNKRYKSMTRAFIRTVLSGDPQGFWDLISKLPWHADTLLQLAEIYRHREEWAQAVDFVDRALFTYERSFIGAFNFTSGIHRLDFDRVENRPFFLAVHRQITDLQRRGCVRTAFEFARLLYSLDPWSDPHGALFHLDFLALKAPGMNQWLLDVYEIFSSRLTSSKRDARADPSLLPGWTYSRALAMWMIEDAAKDNHEASSEALTCAIRSFPSVVPLLADKIEASIPAAIRAHVGFKVQADGNFMTPANSMLHMLSHLYAQHAFGIWKEPAHVEWFTSVVSSLASSMSSIPLLSTVQRDEFIRLYERSETLRYSAYRHIITQESTYRRLFSFIPKQVFTASDSSRSLTCDPLPPPKAVSKYDAEFFDGVEDAFETGLFGVGRRTRRQREADQARLERLMVQHPLLRQIQDIFDANPELGERFPGGVMQFAQVMDQMPPDMLEDILVQLDAGGLGRIVPEGGQGRMPGNFDENERAIQEVADQAEAEGGRDRENDDDDDEDEDDDTAEDEETSPTLIRGLRNFFGRFWGGTTNTGDDDDDDDETDMVDDAGVD